MTIETSTRCSCGAHVVLTATEDRRPNKAWQAHCPNCLDPTEGGGTRSDAHGHGSTPDAALQWWRDAHEPFELRFVPTNFWVDLEHQVAEEFTRQAGARIVSRHLPGTKPIQYLDTEAGAA